MTQSLGQIIKKKRTEHDLSQAEMAKKLNISRPTYIKIEKDSREPTLTELRKLESILNIPKVSIMIKPTKKSPVKKSTIRINIPQERMDKFKEVLLYILEKVGAKPNVGKTVIYKLLYFIDFDFYEKFEEQLIGAVYVKNHHGPTPVAFATIIKNMEKQNEIEQVRSKYYRYDQKKYYPIRSPDLSQFNATEIKHIDEVLTRLADKNANELSEYSHNDVPFIIAKNGQPLEYESVFYRTDETSVRSYDDDSDLWRNTSL